MEHKPMTDIFKDQLKSVISESETTPVTSLSQFHAISDVSHPPEPVAIMSTSLVLRPSKHQNPSNRHLLFCRRSVGTSSLGCLQKREKLKTGLN